MSAPAPAFLAFAAAAGEAPSILDLTIHAAADSDEALAGDPPADPAEAPSSPIFDRSASTPAAAARAALTPSALSLGAEPPSASASPPPHSTSPSPVAGSRPAAHEAPSGEVAGAAVPAADPSTAPAAATAPTESLAAAPLATAAAAPPSPAQDAPAARTTPDTVAALAGQVAKRLDGRTSRFDIALNPDGLGRVAVAVEIGGDGRLTASLAFDHAEAAAVVGGRADELRGALAQAGFHIAADALRFDVAPQAPAVSPGLGAPPHGGAGLGGQGWGAGGQGSGSQNGFSGARSPVPDATPSADLQRPPPAASAAGGLDIRI